MEPSLSRRIVWSMGKDIRRQEPRSSLILFRGSLSKKSSRETDFRLSERLAKVAVVEGMVDSECDGTAE